MKSRHGLELVKAIRGRDVDSVKSLIAVEDPTRVVSQNGKTLLHVAAEEGMEEVVALLLKAGISVNVSTKTGETPLHLAARLGRPIELGSILDQLEGRAGDPWESRARKSSSEESVSALLPLFRRYIPDLPEDLNPHDQLPDDLKWEVARVLMKLMGDPPTFKREIVEAGIDIQRLDPEMVQQLEGYPAYRSTVKLLIDNGAEINRFNQYGDTPLHMAVQSGANEMIRLLLDHKADPNLRMESCEEHGRSPLEEAIEYYNTAAARLMYSFGGRIDFESVCPLHRAASNGQLDLLNWLIEIGGNVNQEDCEGQTPLLAAAGGGHANVIERLLAMGANISHPNEYGRTALHECYMFDCLKLLVSGESNVNVRDQRGRTPLHEAAQVLNAEGIELLIAHGAMVDAHDEDGNTPLHSVFFGEESRPDIEFPTFEALVKAGADRAFRNKEGLSPFDLAVNHDYPKSYLELLKFE